MKILVVLLVVAATICRADDDDDDSSEEVTLRYVSVPSAITHARSAITHVPSAIAHGRSSSPAVMKIPKPGIRFDIPVPQTHGYAIAADTIVPVAAAAAPIPEPVAMPKTTLKSEVAIPAPMATPVPIPMPKFTPVPTTKAANIPVTLNNFEHGTWLENQLQPIPVQYYTSSTNYGPKIQSTFEVPATVQSFAVPNEAAVPVPSAVPVPMPNAVPIHYSAVSEVPHPFTYWGNFKTPQMMTNFMDLNTGRFSYMNVIGDISPGLGYTVPVPQANPWQDHPFKAFFAHRSL